MDTEKGCLLIKTKQGQTRSRPLSELQTIWNELNQKPAVHVEGILHGSGTSRNQPETILANLPYIEWLKLNNKKHIAFVGKNTHPFGTLKQMSPLDSVGISTLDSKGTNAIKVKTVIVTDNVLDTISTLQGNLAGTVSTVEKGVYTFENEALEALVMSSSSAPLLPGCYPVLSDTKTTASQPVKSSISVTKSTTLSTPTKSSSLSERANNEGFYLFCRLTNTPSSSTITPAV